MEVVLKRRSHAFPLKKHWFLLQKPEDAEKYVHSESMETSQMLTPQIVS